MKDDSILKRIFSKENRGVLFLIAFSVVIVLLVIFILKGNTSNYDTTAGGELTTESTPAFLAYQNKPYLPLSSTYANLQLREDMAFYARNYTAYHKGNPADTIMFEVSSTKNKEDVINFTGKFNKDKSTFTVSVEEKNNYRIKTIIESSSGNTKISDELPSSSKRNDFISRLPYVSELYSIEYDPKKDSLILTLYDDSASNRNEAYKYIQKSLDIPSYKTEKLEIIVPASVTNENSAILN